jgi:hypothetical protein
MDTETKKINLTPENIMEIVEHTEFLCKALTVNVVEQYQEKYGDANTLGVMMYALLDFSLKMHLMGTKSVDECRALADSMLDRLASEDVHLSFCPPVFKHLRSSQQDEQLKGHG